MGTIFFGKTVKAANMNGEVQIKLKVINKPDNIATADL